MSDTIYHAVVKLHKDAPPQRMNYRANNVAMAMRKMVEMCGLNNTTEIYEFEILEVLAGNQYKKVAMKLPSAEKPRITPVAVINHKKIDNDPPVVEEKEYIPYKLEAA